VAGAAHDLAAAYVLDALEPDEVRGYERHVEGCAVCRRQVRELGTAAAALALAVPPAEPPSHLRVQVLAAAHHGAPLVVLRRLAVAVAGVAAAAALVLAVGRAVDHGPGTRTIGLVGARGSLVVERNGSARLVVDGLAAAPPGRTYEAWVVGRDGTVPAGLFRGGGSRTVAVLFRRVAPGSRVAVTLERTEGVARLRRKPLFRTGRAA
jgi:anti-sigma-K factor RskA